MKGKILKTNPDRDSPMDDSSCQPGFTKPPSYPRLGKTAKRDMRYRNQNNPKKSTIHTRNSSYTTPSGPLSPPNTRSIQSTPAGPPVPPWPPVRWRGWPSGLRPARAGEGSAGGRGYRWIWGCRAPGAFGRTCRIAVCCVVGGLWG